MHPNSIPAAAHGGLAVWPLPKDVKFQVSRVEQVCPKTVYSKMPWFESILGIPTCFPAQVCLPLDIVILASWSFKTANWQTQNWHRIERSSGYIWPVLFLHRSVCPKLKPNSGGWPSSFGPTKKCGDFFFVQAKYPQLKVRGKWAVHLEFRLNCRFWGYWMALGLIYKCKLVIASTANYISGLTIGRFSEPATERWGFSWTLHLNRGRSCYCRYITIRSGRSGSKW